MTKHSDYFVWKDMSERVTGRLYTTIWQEVSEFLSNKTSLFLREFSNKETCPKSAEMLTQTRS